MTLAQSTSTAQQHRLLRRQLRSRPLQFRRSAALRRLRHPPHPRWPSTSMRNTQTWIKVTTDGTVAFADILQPGTERRFSAERSINVTIGNAAGATLKINGRDLGQLGTEGQSSRTQDHAGERSEDPYRRTGTRLREACACERATTFERIAWTCSRIAGLGLDAR